MCRAQAILRRNEVFVTYEASDVQMHVEVLAHFEKPLFVQREPAFLQAIEVLLLLLEVYVVHHDDPARNHDLDGTGCQFARLTWASLWQVTMLKMYNIRNAV